MGSIIVAMPKAEDAKKISDLLSRRGYLVSAVCTTGATVLAQASTLDYGVVVTSKRLSDMYYVQMAEYLPEFFEILLLTKAPEMEEPLPNVVMVQMPLSVPLLFGKLEETLGNLARKFKKKHAGPKQRSPQEQEIIDNAKLFLMKDKEMTEQEAFRYLQKNSMDTGTGMVEYAQMVLMCFGAEDKQT